MRPGNRVGRRDRANTKRLGGLNNLRALFAGPAEVKLARVVKPGTEAKHWERDGNQVFVHVELLPKLEPRTCRMGGCGKLRGVIWIPAVGTEVGVLIPGGKAGEDGLIVEVFDSGQVPDELDDDTLVIVAPTIKLVAAGDVVLQGGTHSVARQGDAISVDLAALQASLDARYTLNAPGPGVPLVLAVGGSVAAGAAKVKA